MGFRPSFARYDSRRWNSCSAPDAPSLTPEGWRPIEDFAEGDFVIRREDRHRAAPVVARRGLQVFTRTARIKQLVVSRIAIKTSGEHPFYELGRGWLLANELKAGDFLATPAEPLVVTP